MKLLLSIPTGVYSNSAYLPYIWALLKTHLELNYDKEVDVTWLDPIHLETHDVSYCDIFLTSNYAWNWEKNLELTRKVKQLNPNCYVIAGGPQIPFRNKNVFNLYENVDALCFQEGEQVGMIHVPDVGFNEIELPSFSNYDIYWTLKIKIGPIKGQLAYSGRNLKENKTSLDGLLLRDTREYYTFSTEF